MTGFDEYGCGDRIYEHLRRNLIGNLVRNCQERVVSNDHIFCPRTLCWKERNTLAFAKPLRGLCVCSEPNDRPDPLKPRYSYCSFRNGLDRSSLRKSGKNLDITGMDRSSDHLYENIVSAKLFALQLALRNF